MRYGSISLSGQRLESVEIVSSEMTGLGSGVSFESTRARTPFEHTCGPRRCICTALCPLLQLLGAVTAVFRGFLGGLPLALLVYLEVPLFCPKTGISAASGGQCLPTVYLQSR